MRHLTYIVAVLLASPAFGDTPVVQSVTAQNTGGAWTFSVTLSHPDTGWDHYADGWEVIDADGKQLGLRVLAHPHVQEQPFTRSLGGVVVPAGLNRVFIRTRCIVDGWSEEVFEVPLTQ